MGSFRLHRAFLFTLIGSLVLAAAMGSFALLADPGFSRTTGRVIASTLTVTLFSLTSMGCAIAWERGHWRPAAGVGFGVSALSFLIYVVGIWLDLPWGWEDAVFKTMALGGIWSIYCALTCLLTLARLKRSWSWTRYATQGIAAILAVSLSAMIIFEWDDEVYVRSLGVQAILTGCGTICVPILHRLSATPKTDQLITATLALTITCPRCARSQQVTAGRSTCGKCGLKFRIEIEEAVCATCGYPLYMLTSDRCPECGTPIAVDQANGATTVSGTQA